MTSETEQLHLEVNVLHKKGIRHWNQPSNVPLLVRALDDPDREIRYLAAHVLATIGHCKAAFDRAITILHNRNEDPITRSNAAKMLGKIGTEAAIQHLIITATDLTQSEDTRFHAISGFDVIRDARLIPILIQLLDDQCYPVRMNAIRCVCWLREYQGLQEALAAFDYLVRLSDDPHPHIRAQVADWLSLMRDTRALPILHKLLHDETETMMYYTSVSEHAEHSLERLADVFPEAKAILDVYWAEKRARD